ncbi:hypothetical protein IW252_000551 [Zhihengliuella flava]|uniref:SLH domain-containing protein n=2 Tax=Zhihengliuella flava TaxID=1285193 RepID=A0A931D7E3_9MICC|nr:hypothetical protein [Zhihengliuella flava]
MGTYQTGIYDQGAAEIVQAFGDRVFQVNAAKGAIDVLDVSNPASPRLSFTIASEDGIANSVAIRSDGLGVVALEPAQEKTLPGRLMFFDATSQGQAILGEVTVGALPDMVTFSDDGRYAVVANEGEPSEDFAVDPEGSVGVVSLPQELAAPAQTDVSTADFHAFEGDELPDGVRIFGPAPHGDDLPVSRNLEPEYVTTSGTTAYVALQENNTIAVVDLPSATVTDLLPLGAKDWGTVPLDASDRDPEDAPRVNLETYPGLFGLFMPDGLHSYEVDGETYLVTANEGDMREWGDFVGGDRVKNLADAGHGSVCASLAESTHDAQLGRLEVALDMGFDAEAGCYRELYAYGARSFSIFDTAGQLVFDSGADFERITAALSESTDLVFNAGHDNNEVENRSDAKGVEPENLVIGELEGRTYAFIGFERLSGVIIYDITDPTAPVYESYLNNREFTTNLGDEYEALEDAGASDAERAALVNQVGDLGPEGLDFVPAAASPNGEPLLVVGNEVTGTTTIHTISVESGTVEPVDVPFTDVEGTSFEESIQWLYGSGVTAGYTDGTFRPQQYVKRLEMAGFLYRYAGEEFEAGSGDVFTDIPAGHSWAEEVGWAKANGITSGYTDGRFGSQEMITRGQMAAFLQSYAQNVYGVGMDFQAPAESPFADVAAGGAFYGPITWLESTGITGGFGDETFRASKSTTRGEMAAFLERLDAYLAEQAS